MTYLSKHIFSAEIRIRNTEKEIHWYAWHDHGGQRKWLHCVLSKQAASEVYLWTAKEKRDVSYDALTTDAFSGEDILVDPAEDVAGQVIRKIMVDKLNHAMLLLSEDEQLLIYRHYYAGMPETALAALYGISQQAVSKRLAKIRAKLKNLIES